MTTDLEPFRITVHDDGELALLLDELASSADLLADAGAPGPGYGWERIARYLLAVVAPELEDRIEFDSEHSMFCAFGTDRHALESLGARLARLFHHEHELRRVIEAIGRAGFESG